MPSRVLTTTGVHACPASSSEAHTPAARGARQDSATGGRPMRQAAARERCTSAQLRRSNSRRRAHLGPVRGSAMEHSRGSAGVPAPPGESGVGERREAAGAGQGSAAAASEARTTRVRRRARTHGGAARGCTERILCDGVAHGCGGRSWGRGRLGAPGARVDASTLMSSSVTRSGGRRARGGVRSRHGRVRMSSPELGGDRARRFFTTLLHPLARRTWRLQCSTNGRAARIATSGMSFWDR